MATKRRARNMKEATLSDSLRYYLEMGVYTTTDRFPDCPGHMQTFLTAGSRKKRLAAWQLNKEVILGEWIRKRPCSRPWAFWDLDIKEIRRRVGGTGDLFNDWEDYEPYECHLGIPSAWVTVWDVQSYNGLALDIHGKVIPSPWKDGDFTRVAVDFDDPPCFESQAAYLDRLNLLTPTEKAYLKKHPELLKPEMIDFDEDEDD